MTPPSDENIRHTVGYRAPSEPPRPGNLRRLHHPLVINGLHMCVCVCVCVCVCMHVCMYMHKYHFRNTTVRISLQTCTFCPRYYYVY